MEHRLCESWGYESRDGRWNMTSVFWLLTCRPKDWYRLDIVLRACCIESGLWAKTAQSSAYWSSQIWRVFVFVRAWSRRMLKRLPSSRYSTWTPSSCPMTRWKRQVMAERKMLKSTGAKTQPCFTPTFTLKDSDWSSPVSTLACIPSCNCCRVLRNLGGTPSLERFFQSSSRFMVSKALLRSMKAT